jgi:hypothetical protein
MFVIALKTWDSHASSCFLGSNKNMQGTKIYGMDDPEI